MWMVSSGQGQRRIRKIACWTLATLAVIPATATELKPETATAFSQYIRATEARMEDDARKDQFLIIDRLPEQRRVVRRLQQGDVYIEPLLTNENNHSLRVPNGLVHHWAGVIFIPHATLVQVLAVLMALTRTVPVAFAWLVNPLIKNISRRTLFRLLTATRKAVVGPGP